MQVGMSTCCFFSVSDAYVSIFGRSFLGFTGVCSRDASAWFPCTSFASRSGVHGLNFGWAGWAWRNPEPFTFFFRSEKFARASSGYVTCSSPDLMVKLDRSASDGRSVSLHFFYGRARGCTIIVSFPYHHLRNRMCIRWQDGCRHYRTR